MTINCTIAMAAMRNDFKVYEAVTHVELEKGPMFDLILLRHITEIVEVFSVSARPQDLRNITTKRLEVFLDGPNGSANLIVDHGREDNASTTTSRIIDWALTQHNL